MGSLAARRDRQGDREGVWQAVIVDLFFGGPMAGFVLPKAASLQDGIDAGGGGEVIYRVYGTSIGRRSIASCLAAHLAVSREMSRNGGYDRLPSGRLRTRLPGRELRRPKIL